MKREELPASALARLEEWFAANGWRAFDFQREVWNAYLDGESGLVHSATGSGKTLAAWLGALAEWIDEQKPGSEPYEFTGSDPRHWTFPTASCSACRQTSTANWCIVRSP